MFARSGATGLCGRRAVALRPLSKALYKQGKKPFSGLQTARSGPPNLLFSPDDVEPGPGMIRGCLGDSTARSHVFRRAKAVKCSQDAAYRDILHLTECGALQKDPGGERNTGCSMVLDSRGLECVMMFSADKHGLGPQPRIAVRLSAQPPVITVTGTSNPVSSCPIHG